MVPWKHQQRFIVFFSSYDPLQLQREGRLSTCPTYRSIIMRREVPALDASLESTMSPTWRFSDKNSLISSTKAAGLTHRSSKTIILSMPFGSRTVLFTLGCSPSKSISFAARGMPTIQGRVKRREKFSYEFAISQVVPCRMQLEITRAR